MQPRFYERPAAHRFALDVPPALASWDKAGSPGMLRVERFTGHACELAAGPVASIDGPLAICLEVGLPATVPLQALNDLDNYLFPLAQALASSTKRDIVSAWAVKRHAADSYLTVGPAVGAPDPGGAAAFLVKTSASYAKTAYKVEVRDQVAAAMPLPDGGVTLQVAFTVGPVRAWRNLWKPTIDALGPILGHDEGATEWNNRDGRITELGLHCQVDASAGYDILMAIRADSAAPH